MATLHAPPATVVKTRRLPARRKRVCKLRNLIGTFPQSAGLEREGRRTELIPFYRQMRLRQAVTLALSLKCGHVDAQNAGSSLEGSRSSYNLGDVLALDLFQGNVVS